MSSLLLSAENRFMNKLTALHKKAIEDGKLDLAEKIQTRLNNMKKLTTGVSEQAKVFSGLNRVSMGSLNMVVKVNTYGTSTWFSTKASSKKKTGLKHDFNVTPKMLFYDLENCTDKRITITDDYRTIHVDDPSVKFIKTISSMGYMNFGLFDAPKASSGYVCLKGVTFVKSVSKKTGFVYLNVKCKSVERWNYADAVSGIKEYFFLEKLYGKQHMALRKIPRECFPSLDQIMNYLGEKADEDALKETAKMEAELRANKTSSSSSSSSSSLNNNKNTNVSKTPEPKTEEQLKSEMYAKRDAATKQVFLKNLGRFNPMYNILSGSCKVFHHLTPIDKYDADPESPAIVSSGQISWNFDIEEDDDIKQSPTEDDPSIHGWIRKTSGKFQTNYKERHGREYLNSNTMLIKAKQMTSIEMSMIGLPTQHITVELTMFHQNIVKAFGMQMMHKDFNHVETILPTLIRNTPILAECRVNQSDTCRLALNGAGAYKMPDGEYQTGYCLTASGLNADIITGIRKTGVEITPELAIELIQRWMKKFGQKSTSKTSANMSNMRSLRGGIKQKLISSIVSDDSFEKGHGNDVVNCMECSLSLEYGKETAKSSEDYRYYLLTDGEINPENLVKCRNLYSKRFDQKHNNKEAIDKLDRLLIKCATSVSSAVRNAISDSNSSSSSKKPFFDDFSKKSSTIVVYRVSKKFDNIENHRNMSFDFPTSSEGLKPTMQSVDYFNSLNEINNPTLIGDFNINPINTKPLTSDEVSLSRSSTEELIENLIPLTPIIKDKQSSSDDENDTDKVDTMSDDTPDKVETKKSKGKRSRSVSTMSTGTKAARPNKKTRSSKKTTSK